ncbi:MAG TPA: hypothetical protein VHU84_19075, partial [Lacipirellulaceae bacterium]|nr:hypothetical protein [Lacipirellulaceae bacterium]
MSDSPLQPPGRASIESVRLHSEDSDEDLSTAVAVEPEPVDTTSTRRMWIGLIATAIVCLPRYSPISLLLGSLARWMHIRTFYEEINYHIIAQVIQGGCMLLIILWDGAPLSVFGLKKPAWSTDTVTGVLTFAADYTLGYFPVELFVGFLQSCNYHVPKILPPFH